MNLTTSLKKSLFTALSLLLLFSSSASALTVEQAFQMLSRVPADYRIGGTVCEQLARYRFAYKFPPETHRIDVGIVYTNSHGNTLGELDVVVFDRNTGRAVLIGEVKCWKNLKSAMKKAKLQLARFRSYVADKRPIHMYNSTNPDLRYNKKQFKSAPKLVYISQEGGQASGFQVSIGLPHAEVLQLQKMLLSCQKSGKCPRPRQYRQYR